MKLRIATWNIHKGVSALGKRPRVHGIKQALGGMGADVVFLQEVQGRHDLLALKHASWPSQAQHEFLASDIQHAAYGMNAVYDHGHHGNALLSCFPIASANNHDVSDHAFESRGILHCVLMLEHQPVHCYVIHLGLFADPRRRGNVLLIAIMQFAMASLIVQGSLYAKEVLAYDSQKAGMALMPMLVPVIFLARTAGKLYDRKGVRPLAIAGTTVAATGFALWGAGSLLVQYPVIACGMVLLGAGVAFIMPPANTDTLASVDGERRGQVSGLVQTARQLGGACGVAFAAAVSGITTAFGGDLAQSIGAAILAGSLVALLGAFVAFRMPAAPPRGPVR